MWWTLLLLGLLVSLFIPKGRIFAQEQQPNGPIYIVQEGDTLWGIAARFGVSVDELQEINGITDPGQLRVADQLFIPGLEGVQGIIVTETVPLGETLRSLSRRYQVPEETLIRLNRLTGPNDLFVGATLILPEQESTPAPLLRGTLTPGESVLEFAVRQGINPWTLNKNADEHGISGLVPGDVLLAPGGVADGPAALPEQIVDVEIDPQAFKQGKSAALIVSTEGDITISGNLFSKNLNFFPDNQNQHIALQGVHAMTEPGIYPLEIKVTDPDGSSFAYMQMVPVRAVDYPFDVPLTVDPTTIDPSVTKPEDAEWTALATPATPDKLWNGIFKIPSPLEQAYCLESGECWSSRYGNRRSYNGSPYLYFHTGLDVVGKTGTEIYAPADGQVVFTGPLTVRGNSTMINHGWGVYTGYMHQSEILVKPGDIVKAGQLIGRVGGTGRVQGPHLHWEVWVGGVQVDPLDWLEQAYP